MIPFAAETSISQLMSIIWCLYPVAFLVGLNLLLTAMSGDDDDDDEGGGVMTPVYQGA